MSIEEIKLVVVGDEDVGKTTLLLTYVTRKYPSDCIPTVFDNYGSEVMVDSQSYKLHLCDERGGIIVYVFYYTCSIVGLEDYWRIRPLCYTQADIFLLCYSIDDRCSYTNVEELVCF